MMVVLIKYDWSTLIKSSIVSTLVWVNSWNSPNVELKRILQWNRTTNANKNHQRIQNTYTSDKHHYASLYIIVTNLICWSSAPCQLCSTKAFKVAHGSVPIIAACGRRCVASWRLKKKRCGARRCMVCHGTPHHPNYVKLDHESVLKLIILWESAMETTIKLCRARASSRRS